MSEATPKNTTERIIDIIADKSGMAPEEITMDRMITDLGFDSLDAVEFCMEVEKEFNIAIADEEMEKFTNVQSVVNQVEKSLVAKETAVVATTPTK